MKNTLDKKYSELVKDILENGHSKDDRTGTGTISTFAKNIKHDMSEGFPLLTTKKMAFKTMVTELMWFLRGDTNIQYLVQNGCNIWNGDAYKKYQNTIKREVELNKTMEEHPHYRLSQEEFIEKIKSDDEFAEKWGDLGPIYGHGWRNWNSKCGDELYKNYLKKIKDK